MNQTDFAATAFPATVMAEHFELPSRQEAPASTRSRRSRLLVYVLSGVLLLATWVFCRMELYTARSDLGYWLGVVGGVLMLLLFAYPLRKRWSALARLGKARDWFVVHMVLGIAGPIAIIAHSTFHIGSVNAGVALGSMIAVALSGIAGRYIYLHIHRGLGGELVTFEALRQLMGLNADSVRSHLHFAPKVEARLRKLEKHAGRPGDGWVSQLHRLTWLPLELRRQRLRCYDELDRVLATMAHERRWDAHTLKTRKARARSLVNEYIASVQRVAQLSAYTWLFAMWHVLHVPNVFVMVLCAIAHIVAVHAY